MRSVPFVGGSCVKHTVTRTHHDARCASRGLKRQTSLDGKIRVGTLDVLNMICVMFSPQCERWHWLSGSAGQRPRDANRIREQNQALVTQLAQSTELATCHQMYVADLSALVVSLSENDAPPLCELQPGIPLKTTNDEHARRTDVQTWAVNLQRQRWPNRS